MTGQENAPKPTPDQLGDFTPESVKDGSSGGSASAPESPTPQPIIEKGDPRGGFNLEDALSQFTRGGGGTGN